MANQNTANKNTAANRPDSKANEVGRTAGSQNPAIEKADSRHDISNIDRQEGNLNHGECGAGMECEDDKA